MKKKLKRIWTTEEWHRKKKTEAATQGISLIGLMDKEVKEERPSEKVESWKKNEKKKRRFYGVDL